MLPRDPSLQSKLAMLPHGSMWLIGVGTTITAVSRLSPCKSAARAGHGNLEYWRLQRERRSDDTVRLSRSGHGDPAIDP